MSAPTEIAYCVIWEESSCYAMARIKGNAGTNITQATITAITCRVYDLNDSNTLVTTPTVTVSSSVFDTIQTTALDPRWTKDSTGYNFGFAIPASAFPNGDRNYRVEFLFDPTSGDNFSWVVQVNALDLLAS